MEEEAIDDEEELIEMNGNGGDPVVANEDVDCPVPSLLAKNAVGGGELCAEDGGVTFNSSKEGNIFWNCNKKNDWHSNMLTFVFGCCRRGSCGCFNGFWCICC